MRHPEPQELSLGHLLAHVCKLVSGQRRMKMESIGLFHAQSLILFWLWKMDGMSQRTLAHEIRISPPTASNTLKRMERDGLIERRRDETDQRIVRVYLTEKSRRLKMETLESFREMDTETVSVLSEAERDNLKTLLLKIHDHLIAISDGAHAGCKDLGNSAVNESQSE